MTPSSELAARQPRKDKAPVPAVIPVAVAGQLRRERYSDIAGRDPDAGEVNPSALALIYSE
jgi:hypothetical protein